jgi:hypothetical protein
MTAREFARVPVYVPRPTDHPISNDWAGEFRHWNLWQLLKLESNNCQYSGADQISKLACLGGNRLKRFGHGLRIQDRS